MEQINKSGDGRRIHDSRELDVIRGHSHSHLHPRTLPLRTFPSSLLATNELPTHSHTYIYTEERNVIENRQRAFN